jgi:hypothetical protein
MTKTVRSIGMQRIMQSYKELKYQMTGWRKCWYQYVRKVTSLLVAFAKEWHFSVIIVTKSV